MNAFLVFWHSKAKQSIRDSERPHLIVKKPSHPKSFDENLPKLQQMLQNGVFLYNQDQAIQMPSSAAGEVSNLAFPKHSSAAGEVSNLASPLVYS